MNRRRINKILEITHKVLWIVIVLCLIALYGTAGWSDTTYVPFKDLFIRIAIIMAIGVVSYLVDVMVCAIYEELAN